MKGRGTDVLGAVWGALPSLAKGRAHEREVQLGPGTAYDESWHGQRTVRVARYKPALDRPRKSDETDTVAVWW